VKASTLPFPLLPTGFLFGGLLLYVVVETAGVLALQTLSPAYLDEQALVIIMRLFELVGFMMLIARFRVVSSLGLMPPGRDAAVLFAVMSLVCVVGAGVLYMLRSDWFVYLALPAWLHGILGLMLMVLLAPVVEELVFRGLLYRMLRERWGIVLSVAVSAVFFSLVHHGQLVSPQLVGF